MRIVALLRGVTPTGKNRIPKMSSLAKILTDVGFREVQTYIHSGNILLDTDISLKETADKIHEVILEKIGADLAVILKTGEQLGKAAEENPFDESYDFSRIHLVFTNDRIDREKLASVENTVFDGEVFRAGTECLCMYLPRDAAKKRLNTNYLERKLGITATVRKLGVVEHLQEWRDGNQEYAEPAERRE